MDKELAFKQFADRRVLKSMEVPEWGSTVHYYSVPNVDERTEITRAMLDTPNEGYWKAFWCLFREENGARIWMDHQEKEVRQRLDMAVIRRLVDESGIWDAIKGTIDEAKKP